MSPDSITCHKCGNKYDRKTYQRFCPKCGARHIPHLSGGINQSTSETINPTEEESKIVREFIDKIKGYPLKTATGQHFELKSVYVDKVIVSVESSPDERHEFHLYHLICCYSWLKSGKCIGGVGGGSDSVRGLVGSNGKIAKCDLCDRHPAYIWGVLRAMEDVEQDPDSNTLRLRGR